VRVANQGPIVGERRLSGETIIHELIRNMELGQFELSYTVLLPCVFSVYLNPEDHERLSGVFGFIAEDANRALRHRVAQLNKKPTALGRWRGGKPPKEFKIACRDWAIEFLSDGEVPAGDVEIHSELNETAQPGYRGTKTTLMEREPSVTQEREMEKETRKSGDRVYAEVRYEDDSGPQTYLMTQNDVRVGRGGDDQPMDLALYANDEVSREHLVIRRDPATGVFFVIDRSTNGTWLNGKRLKKGAEELLPGQAEIMVAEVIKLEFRSRQ
jgi:FHA domain